MIKKTFFTVFYLSVVLVVFGQTANRRYDSIIQRTLERNIVPPMCDSCTGVTILEISKTDSITVRVFFASDEIYDYSNDKKLVRRINEKCNSLIKGNYKLIVPVYFYFEDKIPSEKLRSSAEKEIKKWKGQANVIQPVIIISYGVQRRIVD